MVIAWLLEPRGLIPRSLLSEKTVVGDAPVPGLRRAGERAGG